MKKRFLLFLLVLFIPFISAWDYPTDGLVAFYDFDGSGNLTDYSDGKNNGTVANPTGITYMVAGIEKNAYFFNGSVATTGYIDPLGRADFNFTANMTLAFWIKTDFATSLNNVLLKRGAVGNRAYSLFFNQLGTSQNVSLTLWQSDDTVIILQSAKNYDLSDFVHIAWVANGSDSVLYINGTETDKIAYDGTISPSTNPFLFGSFDSATENITLDEMGIWNRTLSPSEIESLYLGSTFREVTTEYTKVTTDLVSENFAINFTFLNDTYNIISTTLLYNGTTHVATTTTNGNTGRSIATLIVPAVSSTQNHTFNWTTTLKRISDDAIEEFGSNNYNQTVISASITYCTSGTIAINYTTYDEEARTLLNTTFDATLTYSANESRTAFKNLSMTSTENNTFLFCVDTNLTYFTDVEISLSATGYTTRAFNFNNEEFTNTTTIEKLYLLNDTLGTNVILVLKDSGLSPLEGYTIKIFRKVEETGGRLLVEQDTTDVLGQIVARLEENDVKYELEFYDDSNVLVKTIPTAIVACRASICVQEYIIEDTTDSFSDFYGISDYTSNLSFSNATNTFSFVWVDNNDTSSIHRLTVLRRSFNGTSIVCNSTSSSDSGVLSCAVGDSKASYIADAYRTSAGRDRRIATLSETVGDLYETFGLEGLFWSFILLMTMILIGIFYPPAGIVLYLVGLFVLSLFDVIFINPAIIIAQVAIGVLFIWAFRG